LASLPEVVVLPEPCRPAISTTVGGCEENFSLAVSLPRTLISSSRTILTTCSAGESAVRTSCPMAFSRMWSISSLTTLKLTSASSSAMRISCSASPMFSSVSVPCPRRFLKARCSLSVRFSNMLLVPVSQDSSCFWQDIFRDVLPDQYPCPFGLSLPRAPLSKFGPVWFRLRRVRIDLQHPFQLLACQRRLIGLGVCHPSIARLSIARIMPYL